MTLQRPIATSFNGGELSPRMGGRVDTAIYAVGLETAENFVPTVEGAIVKRPGFEYIREAAPTASWLGEFRFNLTQDYVIEWGEQRLRFYTNGVRIEAPDGTPYEVAVPFGADQARYVSCQQSFDRLYMAHPAHPPGRLTRTSATTFVYETLAFSNGPFADANVTEASTVTVSATEGIGITLTASQPIFGAGREGYFRIEAQDFSDIPAWEAGIDGVVPGAVRRSDGKVYTALSAGRTGTVQPIHTRGAEWDGSQTGTDVNDNGPFGVQWAFRHDRYGIARITGVAPGGLSATADVIRRLPDSLTGVPSWRWAHAAFSAAAGWPGIVAVWNGRLLFIKDFELLASVSGDYLNFATTTASGLIAPDLAFRRTLSTEDPALWAIADRKLIVGTASRELAIGAVNSAAAVSGDNIEAVPQSFYGSAPVTPLQIGTAGIFVQRGGRKLRQAEYDFSRDRYVAANMTVWCRHVTGDGIVQLAFQKEPEELMIGVRGDGQLIVHPHAPEQEIKGFARIVHGGGAIRSAVTVASPDGASDELWVLVDRDGVRSVERMASWRDDDAPIDEAFFVDSGTIAYAAPGQMRFTGATHLAGKAVAVLADGGVVPDIVVNGAGVFTLPENSVPTDRAFRIAVGLPYTARIVTLRPELRGNGETSQGKRQRLVRLTLRLLATAGLKLGPFGGRLDDLIDRPGSATMDAAVPLFTGDTEKPVSGGYDRTGQATTVSSAPLPAIIIAALPKIDVTT